MSGPGPLFHSTFPPLLLPISVLSSLPSSATANIISSATSTALAILSRSSAPSVGATGVFAPSVPASCDRAAKALAFRSAFHLLNANPRTVSFVKHMYG